MTRNEFLEDVNDFDELVHFCFDVGCDECDDIYNNESKDEYYNEGLMGEVRAASDWKDLRETLNSYIGDESDWYVYDEYYCEFRIATREDFLDYKDRCLDYGDHYDLWDSEPENEVRDEETEQVDGGIEDDLDVQLDVPALEELFCLCSAEANESERLRSKKEQMAIESAAEITRLFYQE